ncbi:hypothetical protein [Klebsiella sp. CN_Kp109]|uniref:glycine-rich domain-containing protein n=1 Tax=Klebsiella sp. CN_Kp109 TaxID=3153427 RepID=UPI0032B3BBA9
MMLQHKIGSAHETQPLEVSSLEKILLYQNHDLLLKFRKEWDVTPEQADDIFTELKKFLWLASTCQTECFNITVHEQFLVIDEMWHTFIQFTDAYKQFCEEHLGGFLHHFPATNDMIRKEIKHITSLGVSFDDYQAERFKNQIDKISSKLGIETAVKWYARYAVMYSIENLNSLRKPIIATANKDYHSNIVPFLNLPVEKIYEVMKINVWSGFIVCGCSGKGCGAGCSCNSR